MQLPINATAESLIVKNMEVGIARNYAVEKLLSMENTPEYLCFIGDDMLFPWNGFIMLHEEMQTGKWDVLTGLYFMKGEPPVPLMFRKEVKGHLQAGVHYTPGDVVRVDLTGLDFTLIKSNVFEKIGDAPWFKTGPTKKDETLIRHTEDVFFMDKCLEAGLKIGVHTGIKIAHLYTKTGEVY